MLMFPIPQVQNKCIFSLFLGFKTNAQVPSSKDPKQMLKFPISGAKEKKCLSSLFLRIQNKCLSFLL